MFSQACIIPSIGGGACVAKGWGHPWQRGGMRGRGLFGEGHLWWGGGIHVGGMHGMGWVGCHLWWGGGIHVGGCMAWGRG